MFERPTAGEQVVLVHINFTKTPDTVDLDEFKGLAEASGAEIVSIVEGTRQTPSPKYFIGEGKLEEVRQWLIQADVQLVIFNHELSPAQERNLERTLKVRVLGRTGLILDIFASRARTFEGKLQVELAQLEHLSTRLVRGWTHLERQKGGIGLRGPGETQLETDRRLLRKRVDTIQKRLEKVRAGRNIGRRSRKKNEVPTIALVGYTNAGKSTLFNHLTGASVLVADQLFATLDPTLRTLQLPSLGKVILVDTVGFVQKLPHQLVDAFRSTLEETLEADLLLHVVDAHHLQTQDTIVAVNQTLSEIGAHEVPQLLVMNKIDKLGCASHIEYDAQGQAEKIWLSAHTGEGVEGLLPAIAECLAGRCLQGKLVLLPQHSAVRAALYEHDVVLKEDCQSDGCWVLSITIREALLERLRQMFKLPLTLE